jgi:hypothetical protein
MPLADKLECRGVRRIQRSHCTRYPQRLSGQSNYPLVQEDYAPKQVRPFDVWYGPNVTSTLSLHIIACRQRQACAQESPAGHGNSVHRGEIGIGHSLKAGQEYGANTVPASVDTRIPNTVEELLSIAPMREGWEGGTRVRVIRHTGMVGLSFLGPRASDGLGVMLGPYCPDHRLNGCVV